MQAVTITQITPEELQNLIAQAISQALEGIPQSKRAKPLTIQEAGEFCKCAESTVRKAVRYHRLKFHRSAGRLYFFEEDLVEWIKSK